MNQKALDHRCGVAFDKERLLAISSLLRNGALEIETHIHGGSMGSVLPDGSQVRIRLGAVKSFVPGQIVTYAAKDRLVAHRLVQEVSSQDNHFVITRGDATICCDAPVPVRSVVGIVTESRSHGAWQPVGPLARRTRSSALAESAIAGTVVALLRLNPPLSRWAAACIVDVHRAVMRFVALGRRLTRVLVSAEPH
jgi:hypothetical protein